MLFLAYPEDL